MNTEHKQVVYKNFEVDEAMLPIIKVLNDNGIETLYSCQGDDNNRPYVVIKSSDKAEIFVKTLLMLDFMCRSEKMKKANNETQIASSFEVTFDCQLGEYRYCIRSLDLKNMEYMFNTVLNLMKNS